MAGEGLSGDEVKDDSSASLLVSHYLKKGIQEKKIFEEIRMMNLEVRWQI